jgi:hypothetical protein
MKQADEIKSEMIDRMGYDFGSLFYHLYNETVWLTTKWAEYKELYGTKESRIDLMNKTAPTFFYIIEKTLWKDLLLGISRITDTPEMRFGKETKKNITFRAVSTFIEIPELKQEIENDVSDLLNNADFCRKWRNRRIAHFDYELNINEKTAKPLEPANRKELQDVIKKLQQLTNKLYFHYIGSTLIFDFTRGYNGAISLLYYLQDGLRFKDLKYEKKLSGEWNTDDFESIV